MEFEYIDKEEEALIEAYNEVSLDNLEKPSTKEQSTFKKATRLL